MSARTRVSAAELKTLWMRVDARGLANNLQLGVRIVTLADGRQFETPLDEISKALKDDEAAERAAWEVAGRELVEERILGEAEPIEIVRVRACRECGCTDDNACIPPCWWVEADLCSGCAS